MRKLSREMVRTLRAAYLKQMGVPEDTLTPEIDAALDFMAEAGVSAVELQGMIEAYVKKVRQGSQSK